MNKTANIEIKISGFKGNLELTPDTYDIKELITMLENIENLIFSSKKKDRPIISYQIAKGSVRHIFTTSPQQIIGFNAILGQILVQDSIDFLESPTAKAFENIQEIAKKKNYNIEIATSLAESNRIILDAQSHYYRSEVTWVDAEFYFYGKITNAGGKTNPNIHIATDEMGTLIIKTPKEILEENEKNILYKDYGIRAKGKQNTKTGEIDTSSLVFIDLIDYQTDFDKNYIKKLREKAKGTWVGKVDPDEFLKELRAYE